MISTCVMDKCGVGTPTSPGNGSRRKVRCERDLFIDKCEATSTLDHQLNIRWRRSKASCLRSNSDFALLLWRSRAELESIESRLLSIGHLQVSTSPRWRVLAIDRTDGAIGTKSWTATRVQRTLEETSDSAFGRDLRFGRTR